MKIHLAKGNLKSFVFAEDVEMLAIMLKDGWKTLDLSKKEAAVINKNAKDKVIADLKAMKKADLIKYLKINNIKHDPTKKISTLLDIAFKAV